MARVQQETERLLREQEIITRREAAAQRAEVRRQYIDRERARLTELRQTFDILRQQEQRQDPPLEQAYMQPDPHPQPPPQMPIPPIHKIFQQPPPAHNTIDTKKLQPSARTLASTI
jgi:hypothetical protein